MRPSLLRSRLRRSSGPRDRALSRARSLPVVASLLAVGLWMGCAGEPGGVTGPDSSGPALARSGPPPRLQDIDLGPAIAAQARHGARLAKIDGVLGTGVTLDDQGRPTIRVYLARAGVRGLPTRLDDIPVQTRVTGLLMADSDPTTRARPAPVGFSVGHFAITAGTIGARVLDGSGTPYILSNNHVLANSNDASLGDEILQPGPFDGGTSPADRIGFLADFEPIDFTLGLTTPPNVMDAAVAQVADADLSASTPLDDGYGFPSAVPLGGSPLGVAVKKYGRTTGLTHGHVTAVSVTVNVCYEVIFGILCVKSADFRDQIEVQAAQGSFSGGGDSGSLIVTENGNQPVALLFAGSSVSTIGSPIEPILSRFGVTVDDGSGGGGPTAPSASFTSSCDDPTLTCTFDASGSTDDGTIVSYDWDFGDGALGSGANIAHTYAAPGTYDVTLTVTDDDGLSDTESATVDVGDLPPTASFAHSCTDLSCDFDASGSSDDGTIVSYDWDFGDGALGSGAAPSHTYAAAGTYDVTLTVADDAGQTDAETRAVTVSEPSAEAPTLTASGRKVRGRHVIDLSWTPVSWANVYVFRGIDGVTELIAVLPGSATAYSDATGRRGSAVYTHFVCEGTGLFDTCSNPAFTSF